MGFELIILTGTGACLSLNMRLIPNPGDGIVQAISISLIFAGHLIGVGIGTVLAVIFVGRVVALSNHLFKDKITEIAGKNRWIEKQVSLPAKRYAMSF